MPCKKNMIQILLKKCYLYLSKQVVVTARKSVLVECVGDKNIVLHILSKQYIHNFSIDTYSCLFIDMPGCCAITCKHGYRSQVTPKDVQWISLPKDESLRKAWLFRIHRENEDDFVSEHTVICSYHFKEEDWIPDQGVI